MHPPRLGLVHAGGSKQNVGRADNEGSLVVYAETQGYELTSQIASVDIWIPASITEGQKKMAEYALRTWPLSAE